MGELTVIFAKNVRLLRRGRCWTQEELADRAGLSARYVGKLEREQASPSIDVLERLAEALNVTPMELLGRPKGRKHE